MTQLQLGMSLADRVAVWATANDGAAFWRMCDAFPEHSASDVDMAASEARVLVWVDGGYKVCAPSGREETI